MRTVARMELTSGMEVAADVFSYNGVLILNKGTILDTQALNKLAIYSVMCISVMEPADYATTKAEKIQLSSEFQTFKQAYHDNFCIFKSMLVEFIDNNKIFDIYTLPPLLENIRACAKNKITLLDMLYYLSPDKENLTYIHCFNAALISYVFGKWGKLSAEDQTILTICGFLYDIGMFQLPHSLLRKSSKLTHLEFNQIKIHTLLGHKLLKSLTDDTRILQAAQSHHERCDGSGYPNGIDASSIDIFTKYIAIVDAYEAMTSIRVYRQSLNPLQAIRAFEDQGFEKYDEAILAPLLAHIASKYVGQKIRLSNHKEGEIIMINPIALSRPLIISDGKRYDLLHHPKVEIVSVY